MLRTITLAVSLLVFAGLVAERADSQPPGPRFGPGFPREGRFAPPRARRPGPGQRGFDRRGPARDDRRMAPAPAPRNDDRRERDRTDDRDDGRRRDKSRRDEPRRAKGDRRTPEHRDDRDHDEHRHDEDREHSKNWQRFERSHGEHVEREERESGLHALSRSVDAELLELAAAIRSLDQSYSYKGFRNKNHAWVAGSSFLQNSVQIRELRARLRAIEFRREQESRDEDCEDESGDCCGGFTWRAGQPLDGKRRGRCSDPADGPLALAHGSFVVGGDAAAQITTACRASNELTIEAVFTPKSDKARGPSRIVSLSTDSGSRNFTLGQEGDRLVLRLRTTETGENGTDPEVSLVRLVPGRRHHVVVTYRPGRIVCQLNSEHVLETGAVEGTFANWSEQHLVLGDELSGERDWAGTLESFAIYDCVVRPGVELQRAPRP